MEQYTIKNTARCLQMAESSLRYYDRLGLVSPSRTINRYRCYSEQDLLDLKYLGVMKYAGLSLNEIQVILKNKKSAGCSQECADKTIELLENKKKETVEKIHSLQQIVSLMEESIAVLGQIKPMHSESVDQMITEVFEMLADRKDFPK